MRIKDLSKKDSSGLPLDIETGTSYELKRYTTVGDLYYQNDEKILERENKTPTEGTIFQNDGIIEKENIPENTLKDFKPVSQSNTPHNYYEEEHPDKVSASARFSEMNRGDIFIKKGDVNIENPEEDANHKDLIKSGFEYLTSNQDENNDKLDEEETWEMLGKAGLSAINFNGVIDFGEDIYKAIEEYNNENPTISKFDEANQKLISWKENRYKQIHMNDYKKSQYYTDMTNMANTQHKLQRGSLGYSSNFSQIGQNILKQFGDNDIPEDADEILSLNLSGEYNLTTDKPGTKIKAKDNVTNFITGNAKSENKDNINNYRDNNEERDIKEFSKELKNRNNGDYLTSTDAAEKFSPMKLSDAQARMITMLKNKNTFMKTIGCIYVKPFYSSESFNQFTIPFEFKPEISEGATTAKYAAENLLNRLGSMQVYSGTELSTLTLTTTYIALAPDEITDTSNTGAQHAVNAWEYYWTNNKLEEVELQLRSLVFPSVNEKSGYLVKPPIVQIKMGGEKDNPSVGDLYKYPNVNLEKYLKISSREGNRYKKFVVTSVQIDKLDNNDIYEAPSLYTYSSKARENQEDDGLSAHISPINSSGKAVEELAEGESLGYYGFRKRGFKVTLQMTEVTENFLDIVPDFRAYYDAWRDKSDQTNPAPFKLEDNFGKEVIDSLTATANELASQLGNLEEKLKAELEKAYAIGKSYLKAPDVAIWGNAITASIITGNNIKTTTENIDPIIKKEIEDYEKYFVSSANGIRMDLVPKNYLYKQSYGPSLNVETATIIVGYNYLRSEYSEISTSPVEIEGYTRATENIGAPVGTNLYVKIDRKSLIYNSKNPLGALNTVINIPITSFEIDEKKCFANLYNVNLINYFNELLDSYNKLLDLDISKITDKKVKACLEELLKTFENGGAVYGLGEKGTKIKLTTIPSIETCRKMIENTLTLFTKEIKTLITNVNNLTPIKSNEYLKIGENKINSISVNISRTIKTSNNITFEANVMFENQEHRYFIVFNELKENIPYLKDALKNLVSYITKDGLAKIYNTKMKSINEIPQASSVNIFESNYKDKTSEKFIEEQFYGTKDFSGLNQFTSDKVVGEEGSIIRIASEMCESKKQKEKIDRAKENTDEKV